MTKNETQLRKSALSLDDVEEPPKTAYKKEQRLAPATVENYELNFESGLQVGCWDDRELKRARGPEGVKNTIDRCHIGDWKLRVLTNKYRSRSAPEPRVRGARDAHGARAPRSFSVNSVVSSPIWTFESS